MKNYSIWCEGYIITGGSSGAWKMGEGKGRTFKEACRNFFSIQEIDCQRLYNAERNTYWGCGLYATEKTARKNFG